MNNEQKINYGISPMSVSDYKDYVKSGNNYIYRLKVREYMVDDTAFCDAAEAIIDHKPTKADFAALTATVLDDLKRYKANVVADYAKTPAVKSFTIGNQTSWFDDRQRDSIKSSVEAEKADGRTTTNIFIDNIRYAMSPDDALAMIRSIELYSKDCFTATAIHTSNINACTTIEEVEAYDFKDNYPEKCSFEYQPA